MTKKLWVAGCSIAHGVGVSLNQRWGELLGARLGLPTQFLTARGSSIEWAADQILQANIQQDDIVCWGLTTPNRSLWYDDHGQAQHILNVTYQNYPSFQDIVDQRHLVDLNLAYKAVNYVKQVQNYLNKIGCNYAIGYVLPGLDDHKQILINNLINSSNFFIAYNHDSTTRKINAEEFLSATAPKHISFLDLGSDGMHPGPKQHQLYAEQFYNMLELKISN